MYKQTLDKPSISVDECAMLLGVGKSTIYSMADNALKNGGKPFAVIKTTGKYLISRQSFLAYLENVGFINNSNANVVQGGFNVSTDTN